MKITITDDVVVKFKVFLEDLSTRNPHAQRQVGPAILALVDFVCEKADGPFRDALAQRLTSASQRKKALIVRLSELSAAEEVAALDALEKGLRRLKDRPKKPDDGRKPNVS